ncbi:unnamed protein product [Vitrella brassicaformis CCMP3155]|uniref:Uncharacterized protein n=1 Tax=Vitrella brassicaformis (strain CCMP3155) TaxID=1169540 RepID=A0A0G4ET83_VITBC|nr:unnamed protein product [Vitrella brassicaformis CCMP3155]|eukprot:CEM01648.1 unnamed protein product [Vitrella brassicaformis CCMP3155]
MKIFGVSAKLSLTDSSSSLPGPVPPPPRPHPPPHHRDTHGPPSEDDADARIRQLVHRVVRDRRCELHLEGERFRALEMGRIFRCLRDIRVGGEGHCVVSLRLSGFINDGEMALQALTHADLSSLPLKVFEFSESPALKRPTAVACLSSLVAAHLPPSIQSILLQSCSLGALKKMANDGSGGIDEWRHFVTTLAGKGTVRLLNVSANRLDKTMLRPLAEWVAMGEACTLEELNLAQNALVDGSVGVLLDALQAAQHNRLTILELSENHLASEGAQRLAAFLSSPSCHLQTLKLYRCGIDADGLAAIARAVERNTSLESLTATANGHLSPLWIDRVGRKFLQALMRRCEAGCPLRVLALSVPEDQLKEAQELFKQQTHTQAILVPPTQHHINNPTLVDCD